MTISYSDKLGLRVPDIGTLNWGDEANDNTEIISSILSNIQLGNVVRFGLLASDGGSFQVDYSAGVALVGGELFTITAGNKSATALVGDATLQRNFLYVDSAGVVQISTTAPTGTYALIAIADTDALEITAVYDCRTLSSADKNYIINGGFDVWQRATSQTTTGYGSDDRWLNTFVGGSLTHSQQPFNIGQTDVEGNPKYYSRSVVVTGSGATDLHTKSQRLEDVSLLSGQTITIGFDAKADAAKDIALEFVQHFGTGGSPSADITAIGVNTVSLTTTWQRKSVTVLIPSVSGKTLGTDENDYLGLLLWLEGGSSFDARTNSLGNQSGTFDIANIKIEIGEIATQFKQRNISEELTLCYRYYWSMAFASGNWLFTIANTGLFRRMYIDYPHTMRAVPTVSTTGSATITVDGAGGVDGVGLISDVALATDFVNITAISADAEL